MELVREIIQRILKYLLRLTTQKDPEYPKDTIVISCDGSITKNPGGQTAVGVVVRSPGNPPIELAQLTKGSTNNDAELDAIYLGLRTALQLFPFWAESILIESDSKIAVHGITGKWKLKEPRLQKSVAHIRELETSSMGQIQYQWMKRNSTSGLRRANDLAQTINGVPNH